MTNVYIYKPINPDILFHEKENTIKSFVESHRIPKINEIARWRGDLYPNRTWIMVATCSAMKSPHWCSGHLQVRDISGLIHQWITISDPVMYPLDIHVNPLIKHLQKQSR